MLRNSIIVMILAAEIFFQKHLLSVLILFMSKIYKFYKTTLNLPLHRTAIFPTIKRISNSTI